MPTFLRSVIVDAPPETVFGFHEKDDALRLLSPPFPPVRIIRKTGGIRVGTRVELRIGPIPWVALHTAYEQKRFFEDTQISGPFARWIHRHEFVAFGERTQMTDCVEYQLAGGIWMNRLLGWALHVGLIRMFRYRHKMTWRFCEKSV